MIPIAQATQQHVPEIVEIWKELTDFHRDRDAHFARSEDGHRNFEKHLRDQISSPEAQVLVALDGGRVVGYSLSVVAHYPPVFEQTTYGLICDLAVKQEHRRRGIGGALVAEVMNWFAKRAINRVEVRVAASNEVAQGFWAKQGFKTFMHSMYREA